MNWLLYLLTFFANNQEEKQRKRIDHEKPDLKVGKGFWIAIVVFWILVFLFFVFENNIYEYRSKRLDEKVMRNTEAIMNGTYDFED